MNNVELNGFLTRNGAFAKFIQEVFADYMTHPSDYHFHKMAFKVYSSPHLQTDRSKTLKVLSKEWIQMIEAKHCSLGIRLIGSITKKEKYPFKHPSRFIQKQKTKKNEINNKTGKSKKRSFKQPLAKIIYVPQGGKSR